MNHSKYTLFSRKMQQFHEKYSAMLFILLILYYQIDSVTYSETLQLPYINAECKREILITYIFVSARKKNKQRMRRKYANKKLRRKCYTCDKGCINLLLITFFSPLIK